MKKLELYTHAGCTSGAGAARLIQKVLQDFPGTLFREVDMLEDPEKSAEMGIRISPTLVYNGKVVSMGIPSEKKLREILKAEEGGKKMCKGLRILFPCLFLGLAQSAGATLPDFGHQYSVWNQVLNPLAKDGGFDYKAFKKNPALLGDFLKSISSLPKTEYEKWNKDQKIAFWINAYNALVIKVILDHYPPKKGLSWKALAYPETSIQQIPNVWERNLATVFGEEYSLNRIEHGTLRKEFEEPRIHFALVCAAKGCPPLRKEAYVPERLNAQLEDQARQFFSNPQKAQYDAGEDVLQLSPILRWFEKDFEKDGGPTAFAKKYMPSETAQKLADKTKIQWLDYDWSLNEKN